MATSVGDRKPPNPASGRIKELDMDAWPISKILRDVSQEWGDEWSAKLTCPQCGSLEQLTGTPFELDSSDSYGAGWDGRGNLLIVPIEGECGHKWDFCFGFHKGQTVVFARQTHRPVSPEGA
jgi:hypothetical protein